MSEHFADRLEAAIARCGTPAVVGIDPVLDRLPRDVRPPDGRLSSATRSMETYCRELLECVAPHVPAVKINSGFFEPLYEFGTGIYYRLVQQAHELGLMVIGDIKRGDIGSTAERYALGHIADPPYSDGEAGRIPDAVTLAGYLGERAVRPFVDAARPAGRGMYVLVRPSDPGADEVHEFGGDQKFYQHMAALVQRWGTGEDMVGATGLSCVGAVVAPKDPQSTAALRAALPNTPFLVPGYGAQGADAEACRACFRADGTGAIVNASRSVIYAFENEAYQKRCGDDWRKCVTAACEDFARDVAKLRG